MDTDSTTLLNRLEEGPDWEGLNRRTSQPYDESVTGALLRACHQKMLGQPIGHPSFDVMEPFDLVAKSWILWASGEDPRPLLKKSFEAREFGGALHLMLMNWCSEAIQALASNNREEALRLFHRAIEMGTQYDLDVTHFIRWIRVASEPNPRG